MDINNLLYQKKNKNKNIIVIVIVIIVILLTLVIIFINKNVKKSNYLIDENIQILGIIKQDNNFPMNTHKISNMVESFGLKSSFMNLNNFLDKTVILNGTINGFSNHLPILSIINIKIPEHKLIIDNNKYLFSNDLLSLDFSKDTDLSATKTGNTILVLYNNEPILSIESFICSKIATLQNCEEMISFYNKQQYEVFTSYFGNTFYQIKQNNRISFNEDITIGYIFKAQDTALLLDLSHLIHIIDSKFINEYKKQFIQNECISENEQKIETIDTIKEEILDENLIKVEIEGLDSKNDYMKCKLIIDIRNDWEVQTVTVSST